MMTRILKHLFFYIRNICRFWKQTLNVKITHLDEAGGAFLSWQGEVEVEVGGGRRLAGRSLCLLTLTVSVAVLLCLTLRTCSGVRQNSDLKILDLGKQKSEFSHHEIYFKVSEPTVTVTQILMVF